MAENIDESVGELEDEAPIERVVNLDEVKLYRSRGVVAYLDGNVYDFGACTVTFGSMPLPVTDADNKKIGFAHVTLIRDDGKRRVYAEIAIDYATEERLLAETGDKLYPRVFGAMRFAAIPLFDFQQRLTPVFLRLDGIQISRIRPADERLQPFGEPGL